MPGYTYLHLQAQGFQHAASMQTTYFLFYLYAQENQYKQNVVSKQHKLSHANNVLLCYVY